MSERLRRFTLPALVFIGLFVLAAAVGYLTAPEERRPQSSVEAAVSPGVRGSIQSLSGNNLTLLTDAGPRQFNLAPDATVEVSWPTTASTITAGEWLNVGAIPNGQTLFAIIGLTLIPQALQQSR
jgi:hypothetical protein